jgi:hypothetical protein
MDLNFNTFFSDDIFPGIKVAGTVSKSKRLLMISSCTVKNCVEVPGQTACFDFFITGIYQKRVKVRHSIAD